MAEEFQAGICGGNWWINPSRSVFSASAAAVSPCSMALNPDVVGFGWPSPMDHMVDNNNKARSNSSGDTNNSVCESPSIAFQEVLQKPHRGTDSLLIDSTLQVMGFGLSASDLSQPNLVQSNCGRLDRNNSSMYAVLQEDMGTKLSNYGQDPQTGLLDSSTTNSHQIQALSAGFPAGSASFGYNPVTLLQSFLDGDSQQVQQPFCNNNNRSLNYSSPASYGTNNNTSSGISNNMVSSSWPRNLSAPKQLSQPAGGLHFSNNTPFWNASDTVSNDNNNARSSLNFHSAPQLPQYATPAFEQKPKCNNNLTSPKPNMVSNEDVHQDLGSKKSGSGSDQPVLKRARIETPSPLPTFKVRKEKLGDRITALQQLVSPFGKTDTASVLHEAIEYIKFLHDQVSVLSTPYMKKGAPVQVHQQGSNKLKDQDTPKQDLKSRGLCLVPISSTFPVANEPTADFWTPTFGGTFR